MPFFIGLDWASREHAVCVIDDTGRVGWEGRVEQKVFLGEAIDFQVKVGPRTLLSRRHPTLRTKVGEAIYVQLDPEKCTVLKVS